MDTRREMIHRRLPVMGCLVALLWAGLTAASCRICAQAPEEQVPEMRLFDLSGNQVHPFTQDSGFACQPSPFQAVLFLFVRSDCPISNRYAPEVQRLHEKFSSQGVRFWLAYADQGEPTADIRHHLKEYGLPGCVLRDPHHDLAELAGASITPEAAVFSRQGQLLYRGRIDDRFVDFGKARSAPTRRDLEEAVEAILEGKPVPNPRTQAVGCFLSDLK